MLFHFLLSLTSPDQGGGLSATLHSIVEIVTLLAVIIWRIETIVGRHNQKLDQILKRIDPTVEDEAKKEEKEDSP